MKRNFGKTISFLMALIVVPTSINAQESFITLVEVTDSGNRQAIPQEFIQHHVDINSFIAVNFLPDKFALDDSPILNSAESKTLKTELKRLHEILIQVKKLPRLVKDLADLRIRLLQTGSPDVEDEFRQKLGNHGKIIEEVIAYLRVVNRDGLTRALFSSNSDSALASLLSEQINSLERQLETETMQLIRNDSLTIRAWCIQESRGKEPTAIHLENYDDLPGGSLQLIDKVSLARSEDEERHLQESLEFHDDLRNFIKDMSNGESEIRQTLKELRESLFSDLEDFASLFGTDVIEDLLNGLEEAIRNSPAGNELQQLQSEVTKLRTDLQVFFDLRQRHAEIVNDIKSASSSEPLAFLSTIKQHLADIQTLQDDLNDITDASRINRIKNDSEALIGTLRTRLESFPQNLQLQIKEFMDQKAQAWVKRFQNVDEILGKYAALKQGFGETISSFTFVSTVNDNIDDPGALIPEEIRNVSLAEAKPTKIAISSTNRQENDVYKFNAQVLRRGSLISSADYTFKIKTYGWYNKWIGSLVFVKGDWQNSFQPATSASWILHHRSRPESMNSEGAGILGNVINLGIGLNSVVFSTDGNIEFGLGGSLTMLNDIVQIGGGINFQQEEPYFLIGASFFDIIKQTPL